MPAENFLLLSVMSLNRPSPIFMTPNQPDAIGQDREHAFHAAPVPFAADASQSFMASVWMFLKTETHSVSSNKPLSGLWKASLYPGWPSPSFFPFSSG
jgi:hypothetical protein